MTDEQLNREWKPNGRRPMSTIAQSFSQELGELFRIDNSLAELGEQVDKRKQHVFSQTNELSELETRIREMESRLRQAPATTGQGQIPAAPSPRRAHQGRPGTEAASPGHRGLEHRQRQQYAQQRQQQQQQYHDSHKYPSGRPGTARSGQQAVQGGLPPTPVGSDGMATTISRSC